MACSINIGNKNDLMRIIFDTLKYLTRFKMKKCLIY